MVWHAMQFLPKRSFPFSKSLIRPESATFDWLEACPPAPTAKIKKRIKKEEKEITAIFIRFVNKIQSPQSP